MFETRLKFFNFGLGWTILVKAQIFLLVSELLKLHMHSVVLSSLYYPVCIIFLLVSELLRLYMHLFVLTCLYYPVCIIFLLVSELLRLHMHLFVLSCLYYPVCINCRVDQAPHIRYFYFCWQIIKYTIQKMTGVRIRMNNIWGKVKF